MKKLSLVLVATIIIGLLFGFASVSQAEVLISTTVASFNTSVDTTSTVGYLIPYTYPRAKIKKITASWDEAAYDTILRLYDTLTLATAGRLIYEVRIPSGTTAQNHIQENYDKELPKIAEYGCLATTSNASHNVSVVLEYW